MQVFVNRCLRCILNLQWPGILSNEDLWEITKQEPSTAQIRKRKWHWIWHTLRKPEGSIEKAALDWNPHGAWRHGRPNKTRRRNRRKRKDLERGEEVSKWHNKMEKLHICWKHLKETTTFPIQRRKTIILVIPATVWWQNFSCKSSFNVTEQCTLG
jgi:hypothetical protein